MTEADVRLAALGALETWSRPSDNVSTDDASPPSPFVHPDCAFCIKSTPTDGTAQPVVHFGRGLQPPAGSANAFLANNNNNNNNDAVVDYVKVLAAGQRSAASCQVSGDGYAGFLVLLLCGIDDNKVWTCISAVLATVPDARTCTMLPAAFAGVAALTMDGYGRANRACDGARMAEHFHETCRLTYVDKANGTVKIINAPTFCQMVEHRYEMPLHAPYAHLKHDIALLSQTDSLLSIDFCTPDVALVTLRVGHPPFLWTDVLTCCQLPSSDHDNGDPRWWIVAKSSESEPFLLEHARLVA
jgi:hypothetical protein